MNLQFKSITIQHEKKKKKKSSLYLRSEEEKITTLKSWTDILL